jgi:hypothetical protein
MKKIKLTYKLFVIIPLILMSCSSDDDINDSQISAEIYGTWNISSSIYAGETESLDECELLETFEFFENDKLDIREYDMIGNNTECTLVGGNTLLDYSVENNILTYTNPTGGYNGGEFTKKFHIRVLNDQSLKLELFYEIDGFGEEGNISNDEIWISNWTRIN